MNGVQSHRPFVKRAELDLTAYLNAFRIDIQSHAGFMKVIPRDAYVERVRIRAEKTAGDDRMRMLFGLVYYFEVPAFDGHDFPREKGRRVAKTDLQARGGHPIPFR